MASRLSRAWLARFAVGIAVLAFPLLASGVAQASLAGAIPATTVIRPDLRSATLAPSAGSNAAEVCFDKTLKNILPGGFLIGGYRAGNTLASNFAAVDPTNTNCVIVTWDPNLIGDINEYTFVTASAGAVEFNNNSVTNVADSVGLTGSTTNDGTTGLGTGPNLVGVLAPSGANQVSNSLTFVFDQSSTTVNADRFFYETAAGQECSGLTVQPAGFPVGDGTTTITVVFSTACTSGTATVSQAVRAGVFGNPGGASVVADSDPASFNFNSSTVLPNCTTPCTTSRPDLVSATLNSDFDSITYTFDRNVIVFAPTAFVAELANGQSIQATSATCTGGTSCVAQFSGALSTQAEFAVAAFVFQPAVEAADNPTASGQNLPGEALIGDNAGAFASGFTTGPDVFGITINHTSGAVTVNSDARLRAVAASGAGLITLYDATGNPVAATYTPSFNSSQGPGPEALTLQYSPSLLTNVTMVQFQPGALTGALVNTVIAADAKNVAQIVDPVDSAAILKAYYADKARHAKHHQKKAHKRSKKH